MKKVKKSNISLGFNQYEINGYRVKVGRNNIENDTVTFSAKPTDIWMHAKDYHSAHLIIETNGESIEKISDELLIKCAEICSYYSGARESGKCEVVYCYKKHVKKQKRAKPGSVIYTDFKSITVKPDKNIIYLKN